MDGTRATGTVAAATPPGNMRERDGLKSEKRKRKGKVEARRQGDRPHNTVIFKSRTHRYSCGS